MLERWSHINQNFKKIQSRSGSAVSHVVSSKSIKKLDKWYYLEFRYQREDSINRFDKLRILNRNNVDEPIKDGFLPNQSQFNMLLAAITARPK